MPIQSIHLLADLRIKQQIFFDLFVARALTTEVAVEGIVSAALVQHRTVAWPVKAPDHFAHVKLRWRSRHNVLNGLLKVTCNWLVVHLHKLRDLLQQCLWAVPIQDDFCAATVVAKNLFAFQRKVA